MRCEGVRGHRQAGRAGLEKNVSQLCRTCVSISWLGFTAEQGYFQDFAVSKDGRGFGAFSWD